MARAEDELLAAQPNADRGQHHVIATKLTALDRLREEYETYLREQPGLAEFMIENRGF